MGWHPTAPEYAKFPTIEREAKQNVIKIKRGANVGSANSEPVGRKMRLASRMARALVKHARHFGYLNGVKIAKARS